MSQGPLARYEVGNALMRGRAGAGADQVATVLEALAEVCPALRPTSEELAAQPSWSTNMT